MIRPGTGSHVVAGAEHRVVDPHRHHGHPVGRHAHLGGDVGLRRLRHGDDPGQRPGHLDLHAQEAEPAALAELLPRVGGVAEGQLPVDGDRVVQGRRAPASRRRSSPGCRSPGTGCRGPGRTRRGGRPASGGPGGRRSTARGSPPCTSPRTPGRRSTSGRSCGTRRGAGPGTGRGRGRGRGSGTGVKPTPSSTSGQGWPAKTSTEWPRATSSRVRWRV